MYTTLKRLYNNGKGPLTVDDDRQQGGRSAGAQPADAYGSPHSRLFLSSQGGIPLPKTCGVLPFALPL